MHVSQCVFGGGVRLMNKWTNDALGVEIGATDCPRMNKLNGSYWRLSINNAICDEVSILLGLYIWGCDKLIVPEYGVFDSEMVVDCLGLLPPFTFSLAHVNIYWVCDINKLLYTYKLPVLPARNTSVI